jgi:hypothetical protein
VTADRSKKFPSVKVWELTEYQPEIHRNPTRVSSGASQSGGVTRKFLTASIILLMLVATLLGQQQYPLHLPRLRPTAIAQLCDNNKHKYTENILRSSDKKADPGMLQCSIPV